MTNKPPSKRLDLLKDRNSKLSAQVSVQRQEINRLQRTLGDLQDKEEERQETVLCVNRLWEELNGSISFLSFRATGNLSQNDTEADENRDSELLEQANPFLAKLLSSCLGGDRLAASTAKSLVEDLSEIETALRKRMSATLEAAARVFEAVEEARCSSLGTPREGGAGGGTPTAASASASKESQLAAMNNLLKAENNRLKDQALHDATKIKGLASSLADKEEELLVAQRKFVQMKEAGGPTSGLNASIAPTASPATQPSVPGGTEDASARRQVNSAEQAALVAELENVKRVLQRREVEVEERDGALAKSEREAREMRAKLTIERENAARARESAKEQVKYYKAELDGLDGRLREFQRERDHLLDNLHDAKREIDIGRDASRRLRAAREDIDSLKNRIADAQAKQAAAESEVDRLRATAYTAPSAEELSKMVSSLQKDLASLKKSRDKHKAAAEGAETARTTAAEATRLLAESKAQLETVKLRLKTARTDALNWAAERKAAVEREEELRLFAEVSQNLLLGGSDGGNANGDTMSNLSADAMKKQITQFLDKQAAAVSQRLETATKAADGATSHGPSSVRESELLSQVEALEEERAVLTARVESLQKEADALRAEAAVLREDGEAVLKEVESVSEAYEAAQEENVKLLASIQNRDEENVRLLREAAAATRERSNMVDEKSAAVEAARRAEQEADIARRAVEELDARVNALSLELGKARKDARQLSAQADGAVREAAAARAAVDAATRDAEAARNEAKTRAAERDTEAEALHKEKTRADRALADAADLQDRIRRLGTSAAAGAGYGGGGDKAEVAALLKMVNCNVCHARMKDRIITKCNHLFCSHCIDANLNTRHRKCPGCGDRFGVNDVKPFYFT
ncbi:hypothetical protein Ndes2526B_g02444 [Nannochloris sp. 'desiccata']